MALVLGLLWSSSDGSAPQTAWFCAGRGHESVVAAQFTELWPKPAAQALLSALVEQPIASCLPELSFGGQVSALPSTELAAAGRGAVRHAGPWQGLHCCMRVATRPRRAVAGRGRRRERARVSRHRPSVSGLRAGHWLWTQQRECALVYVGGGCALQGKARPLRLAKCALRTCLGRRAWLGRCRTCGVVRDKRRQRRARASVCRAPAARPCWLRGGTWCLWSCASNVWAAPATWLVLR